MLELPLFSADAPFLGPRATIPKPNPHSYVNPRPNGGAELKERRRGSARELKPGPPHSSPPATTKLRVRGAAAAQDAAVRPHERRGTCKVECFANDIDWSHPPGAPPQPRDRSNGRGFVFCVTLAFSWRTPGLLRAPRWATPPSHNTSTGT